MPRNKVTSISNARTIQEIGDFWDTHSLADYWEQTQEAEFEVRAKRRHRVIVDPDVYSQIEERARINGVAAETLVNLWLAERLRGKKGLPQTKKLQRTKVV